MIQAIRYLRKHGSADFHYVYGPQLAAFYTVAFLAAVAGAGFVFLAVR